MFLQTLVKNSGEKLLYGMDFANRLQTGEAISSITSTVLSPTTGTSPLTQSGGSAIVGTQVQFTLLNGDDSAIYEITVTIVTSAGNIIVGQGLLRIRNLVS